jgi:hypothetical protein
VLFRITGDGKKVHKPSNPDALKMFENEVLKTVTFLDPRTYVTED